MLDKRKIAGNFGRHAAAYDQYARVQKKMADRLMDQLRQKKNYSPGHILEIGCGTGYLTEQLTALFPQSMIEAVDLAPEMIGQAKKKISSPFLSFSCADIETMPLSRNYDLIVSNAAFQWLESPEWTINRLIRRLSKNGVFALTMFCENTFNELRVVYRELALNGQNAPVLDFYPVREIQDWFHVTGKGFSRPFQFAEWTEMEYFPGARDFLDSVRKIGAGGGKKNGGTLSVSQIKEIIGRYEKLYLKMGIVQATYHCMSCISGPLELKDE